MTNMTPSTEPITEGQIGKLNQNVTARLLKKKNELPSNIFEQILGDETLVDDIYIAVKKRVDAISKIIARIVTVNRKRSAKEALSATGRVQYVNDSVVAEMPNGETEETEVVFFKPGYYVSVADVEKEYKKMSQVLGYQIVPADPFTLAAVNEEDPAFADDKPNGTQWKNAKGKYCYAIFNRSGVGRRLSVSQDGSDWNDYWWFVGVRKKAL